MKKSIAIFLFLLYASVAFGIGVECSSYLDGKLVHSSAHKSVKSQCDCFDSPMNMDCCGAKPLSCKTDNAKAQIIAPVLQNSFAEHFANNSLQAEGFLLDISLQEQAAYHPAVPHFQSSRDLLSFIHTLRI